MPIFAGAGLALGVGLSLLARRPASAELVWFATLLGGAPPLLYGTFRRLQRRELSSDLIAACAIVGSIVLDQAFAGVVIVLMQSGGEALERYAFDRASTTLDALRRRAPERAVRFVNDRLEEVAAADLCVGDRILVRSGDVVAADGEVEAGPALLDESSLTGEPLPRSRRAGESVASGVVNVGAPFVLLARQRSQDSQYARMVRLALDARADKPRIQRLADRYATVFTPLALLVALGGFLYTHSPVTFLAVLVVATPCPLILATPVAVLVAMNRASEAGLLAKGGSAMEALGRTRAVLLDKTGTLTEGRPDLEQVRPSEPFVDSEVLAWAASVESHSSHPLARATVREAQRRGIPLRPVSGAHEQPGAGIVGSVMGRRVAVGSWRFVTAQGATRISPELSDDPERRPGAFLLSYVSVDGLLAGTLRYADRLRPGAPRLIARLRELGVEHVQVVTGDRRSNAERVAAEVGITEVGAELTPSGKVDAVRAARRRYGYVAMVGDGTNDAAALTAASVGIALGAEGAGITAEAGDVVLLSDQVVRVADGIAIGQRMLRIAQLGIVVGLGASGVLMVLAASGAIIPALGAGLQEVIDVAVILNALRV